MEKAGKRKILTGTVTSDKMQKTVVVKVISVKRHEKYHKKYTTTKHYKAHDEAREFRVGDVVTIEETRPISRDKKWKVIKKAISDQRTAISPDNS